MIYDIPSYISYTPILYGKVSGNPTMLLHTDIRGGCMSYSNKDSNINFNNFGYTLNPDELITANPTALSNTLVEFFNDVKLFNRVPITGDVVDSRYVDKYLKEGFQITPKFLIVEWDFNDTINLDKDRDGYTPECGDCDDDSSDDPLSFGQPMCPTTKEGCIEWGMRDCAVCRHPDAFDLFVDRFDEDCDGEDGNDGNLVEVVEMMPWGKIPELSEKGNDEYNKQRGESTNMLSLGTGSCPEGEGDFQFYSCECDGECWITIPKYGQISSQFSSLELKIKLDVDKLSTGLTTDAKKLVDKFWPGPLTIVLKKKRIVPKIISAGLDTVAIRMPESKIAFELIRKAGVPIAAPSANLSGRPSPTIAQHVINDLNSRVDVIIDGGNAKIGVESTVIDMTTTPPTLLRPGGVTLEQLEAVIGEVKVFRCKSNKIKAKSPGMKYTHYSPHAGVLLIEGKRTNVKKKIRELSSKYKEKNVWIITRGEEDNYRYGKTIFTGIRWTTFSKNIFKILRDADLNSVDIIIVEGVPDKDIGLAIMNRLRKAADKVFEV